MTQHFVEAALGVVVHQVVRVELVQMLVDTAEMVVEDPGVVHKDPMMEKLLVLQLLYDTR